MRSLTMRSLAALAIAVSALSLETRPASAERIKNPVAVFNGLDKITGRTIAFEVNVDETVQFGALQVTPRVCFSRSATENPQTTAFIEVDELTLQKETKRIFAGWMFASSPGLHAVEHPVYDIWLTNCRGGKPTEEPPPATTAEAPAAKPKPRKGKAVPAEEVPAAEPPADADAPIPDDGTFVPPLDPALPVD
jgi:hypothetical protein